MVLPALIGSPKQVAWAEELREQWLHSREAAQYPEFRDKLYHLRYARDFIDGRDSKLFIVWQEEQNCSPAERKAKEAVLALKQYLRDCLQRGYLESQSEEETRERIRICSVLEGFPEQVALAEKIRRELIAKSSPELVARFFADKQTDWWIVHQQLPLQRYAAYISFVDQEQIKSLVKRAEECLLAVVGRARQGVWNQLVETKVVLLDLEKKVAFLRGVQTVKIPFSLCLSENLRFLSFLLSERGDRVIVPRSLVERVCSDKSYAVRLKGSCSVILFSEKKVRCSLASLTNFFPLLGAEEQCEPLPIPPASEVIVHIPEPLEPVLTLQIPHELTR